MIDLDGVAQDVVVDLAGGKTSSALAFELHHVESVDVRSGVGNDSLRGGAHADRLDAGIGHDKLEGLGGDDLLTM